MGSVRERLNNTDTTGIKMGRSENLDHSNATFGTMQVVGKIENAAGGIRWKISCNICGATGATISQGDLSRGVTPVCAACGGKGFSAEPAQRESRSGASVEQHIPQQYTGPRERAQQAAREAELKALEGGE